MYNKRKKWFLFLIVFFSTFILLLFFPRGGRFKYEYQKGKPWMHEVLIAPFDFPIYKTDYDITKEKDSILNTFPAYYNYNSLIGYNKRNQFLQEFDKYWIEYNKHSRKKIPNEFKNNIKKTLLGFIDLLYNKGIIDLSGNSNNKVTAITVVKNNIAELTDIDNIFTISGAKDYTSHELEKYKDNFLFEAGIDAEEFFNGLKIEKYITNNLFYDPVATEKMKNEAINNVSFTEGMVLMGERIIFTGEIVNDKTYRILESLKKEYEQRTGFSEGYIFFFLGQLIIVLICLILLYNIIRKFYKSVLTSLRRAGFIFFTVIIFAALGSLISKYWPAAIYIVPFSMLPIIIKTFYDSRVALFVHIITILLVGFWAPNSFEFTFINMLTGIVAIISYSTVYRRNKIFITSTWVVFSYHIIYIGLLLYQDGSLKYFNQDIVTYFIANGFFILSSIPLIYVFEKTFGFFSDASLLELADTNQPLLRKLVEYAPGTFQHSLQVANLSEEAIYKIGGNPLLVRAGALYHDIGKMENPSYYIENLSENFNPHVNMTAEESAQIIISHVEKGVELARQFQIPQQIIDFIITHHGTTPAYYFYHSYLKENPYAALNLDKFRYKGKKPFSRETAVLMMADSIEAASRSLKSHSEREINILVDSIIDNLIKEKQFDEANITFKDVETIKSVFKKRLINIYHDRIEYP